MLVIALIRPVAGAALPIRVDDQNIAACRRTHPGQVCRKRGFTFH
jgi:hypothetical protein